MNVKMDKKSKRMHSDFYNWHSIRVRFLSDVTEEKSTSDENVQDVSRTNGTQLLFKWYYMRYLIFDRTWRRPYVAVLPQQYPLIIIGIFTKRN